MFVQGTQMRDPIFARLALLLDSLPNRFPPTKSGVEIRLLEKIFSPEEATIACAMTAKPEPAAVITARAGVDAREGRDHLKKMAAKGLINVRRGEGEFTFCVKPFIVGFYENQLDRIDAEMAALFEEYFNETKGALLRDAPAHHRVIPVEQAIPFQIEIQPYERATALLENALSWGVRDCICRVQQKLVGKGCERPVSTCLVFAPVQNAFVRSKTDRVITRDEAVQILRSTEEAGLVHTVGNYRDGIDYICNCCSCCCGILRGIAQYGISSAVAHSDFFLVVEDDACTGCNNCIERCQFNALLAADGIVAVDYQHCMGCGICVVACTVDALHLERRPEKEITLPPSGHKEWGALRQASRGEHP
jgi:Na+-translocating ferredoxin:NAD+ oxidoreductase subunit B